MADSSPAARSPIAPAAPEVVVAGWVVSGRRSDAALTITDQTPMAKVAVRADDCGAVAELFGTDVGRASRRRVDGCVEQVLVTRPVPGEWLVLAGPGEERPVVGWLVGATPSDRLVSVVDLTHGRALLRLTGARAADLLAKECAVDLGDRGCPDRRALRTAMAGLAVDVVRDDRAGVPSYLLACERASGQYLLDSLLDSGADLGLDVDGFRPTEAHD